MNGDDRPHGVATQSIACLTCRQRVAGSRGRCPACYARHFSAVSVGTTTWARLEQQGLTAPVRGLGYGWRRQQRPARR
jgi:hypothetical protein